jgi:regulator of sigma E protease
MEVLIQILHFLLSLSILIVVHEFGHFIAAKAFKTRVEKFYLFFNPGFSIFKFNFKGTEYGLGWLPLGGYVKISGMIDESMDKEQLKQPAQPWEFRTKPSWQRLIIMLGGVIMNVLLAVLIYTSLLFVYGEKYLPTENLKDGIWVQDPVMTELGLQTGDKIISINDNPPPLKYNEVLIEMLYSSKMIVERSGEKVEINIPKNLAGKLSEKRGATILPRLPFVVAQIPPDSHNHASGLEPMDRIISIDGQPITYFDEFKALADNRKGQTTEFEVVRNGDTLDINLLINDEGLIGVQMGFLGNEMLEEKGFYQFEKQQYSIAQAIPAGFKMARQQLSDYVRQFKLLFNPDTGAYKGLGGFITIGSFFPDTWDWQTFWRLTAFLSIMLAFLNILPIPALDGGHVMFLLYEIIAQRKPSDKFMEYAQVAGMVILFGLLIFANGNDVLRLLQNWGLIN